MKLTIFPKTTLGKWAVMLILGFFLFLGIFFILVNLGERGGETIFINIKLLIFYSLAAISAISSFVTGLISIFKKKEKSVLVFLSVILGFLVLLWILSEILFPH